MIQQLFIKDFAVIDSLDLDVRAGAEHPHG